MIRRRPRATVADMYVIGKWLIEAISRRDYPVLQGGMLLLGVVVMLVNLLVDLTYGIINPRIRHQS